MSEALTHSDILAVRDASRRMVRELGFMQPTLAETDLAPSAVHAIIEIGNHGAMTANQLGQLLMLEKSTVSRMLARLGARGLIEERPSETDGRAKILSLTPEGRALLGDINRFANLRVGKALHFLNGPARQRVVGGLSTYADALRAVHDREEPAPAAIEIHDIRRRVFVRVTGKGKSPFQYREPFNPKW